MHPDLRNDPIEVARSMIQELRVQAAEFPQSRKRDIALYEVLAGALRLVQILHRDGLLSRASEILPKGTFLKGNSDVYSLASKLVFEDRCLVWRASYCLRGLGAAKIPPEQVVEYLKSNGGMNSFAAERRRGLETVTTRFLRLDSSITIPRGGSFTLNLRHVKDTTFHIEGEPDGQ